LWSARSPFYETHGEHKLLHGLLRRTDQVSVLVATLLGCLAIVCGVWLVEPLYLPAFLLALSLDPLRTLTELRQAAIQGLHHPEVSLLPLLVL
jgi:ABC-type multidrug transport system permease subunit